MDVSWKSYALNQSRGALPTGPLVILVHLASVWVPFSSESKEAGADYDVIRKEIRLAVQACGRRLGTYVKRRARARNEAKRREVFNLYIEEVVGCVEDITSRKQVRFREDLLARINLWTYRLPGLRDRPEDIEPNLDYELSQSGHALNLNLTMSREARSRFLAFARSEEASWAGNFRDLSGAVRRMATLCTGGRIGVRDVDEELGRLRAEKDSF